MVQFINDLYGDYGKKIVNTFGFTPEQYLRLEDDVKQMLIHEYWLTMNNQNNKNEMDMTNDEYSNEYHIKSRRLSIFRRK